MNKKLVFEKNTFSKRLKSMIKVDFLRMFSSKLLYIMVGICLVVPILILVMTKMMDGSVSVNPQTGQETVIKAFDNVWQIISSKSGDSLASSGEIDMMAMCNINLIYFGLSVLVCVFVSQDFKSGYSKNLFTVRSNKTDYVISKSLVFIAGGIMMITAFFIGTYLGGIFSGVSLKSGVSSLNLLFCYLSKCLVVGVFVPIYLIFSVTAKGKAWLSLLLSLGVGMFLFMMIPLLTPLDATFTSLLLCIVGSIIFCLGLGYFSKMVLDKTSLL